MVKKNQRLSVSQLKRRLSNSKFHGSSAKTQRQNILRYFQEISSKLTVGEARELLGVMYLPARVLELRRQGYNIVTLWIIEIDNWGVKHRNGVYVYRGRVSHE